MRRLVILLIIFWLSRIGGLETLRKLAGELYGDKNPAEKMFDGKTHQIVTDVDGNTVLIVPLPFANKDDLDLYRSRDELTLRVGPYRRNIVLPYALWDLEIGDAKFEQSSLRIHFVKYERTQRQRAL